jgi:hypothetical protein
MTDALSMRRRKLVRRAVRAALGAGLVMLLAPHAVAADPPRELYVIDAKRPAVAIVDPLAWKTVGSIPIPEDPTAAVLGKNGRHLYVLHRGLFKPGRGSSPGGAHVRGAADLERGVGCAGGHDSGLLRALPADRLGATLTITGADRRAWRRARATRVGV